MAIPAPHSSRQRLLFIAIAALVLFIITTILVFNGTIEPVDQKAIQAAYTWETPLRNKWMLFITFLGNYQFLVPANLLVIIFFFLRRKKRTALLVLLTAVSGLLLKLLLKELFHRPRPDRPLIDGIANYSYPSGHALMSIAFYGLLIILADQLTTNRAAKRVLYIVCILIILLIGFSRIYLRVHYPTDILGGYCLGLLWISGFALIWQRHYFGLNGKR